MRRSTALHLRAVFRWKSSSATAEHCLLNSPQFSLSKPHFLSPSPQYSFSSAVAQLKSPFFLSSSALRSFSSEADERTGGGSINEESPEEATAGILSAELLKDPQVESLPILQRLDLSFSHIALTHSLIRATLNLSPDSGRAVLGFLDWVKTRPNFELEDEVYSCFVDYFGRKKDFKATHDVLIGGRGVIGAKTLESMIDRLVRAGRPTQTVAFFEKMEKEYGFVRNMDSLKLVVSKLCEHGFASYAEKMVKSLANEFFPDEYVCEMLIKGWCVDEKLDEAQRLAGEMYRGGFEIGTPSYNAILDCVCKLCRRKDPFRLQSEVDKLLLEMEEKGVPRDVETFNVLVSNLCKIRQTQTAIDLFYRMGEWGCHPNETTFLTLIRSLYQAARVGEGDEMIDRMKSAGYGDALDKKAYYGFLKILCGIERIDHAMNVFTKMKEDGCKPGIKTYELLMGRLVAHGRMDKANALYKEAESDGIQVEPKAYKVDPRFAKKKSSTCVKKEKKRETLPEKMARKRRTLKKIRLSYVKKPRGTRRAL
ncbi:PREDICTED: pentatricopeptide repeat-containing protein PNM1, mitochondrial [Ipomoea nil]|uniref:pentatricopeptide repeat-containing protein PNM1, mitochondrial n=1 Tax=Ipomoea nil TaxID=35883 RepID=UPI0009011471|nr:PREDICTED: pentatricopeptide repeat-containing protein PNM1, mitochondrial [Ipomoea nil]